ncbi:MAG: SAM-dependent methyltransferase [Cycloclasticus sp. symbiont of Poecilosclerida sp. M]|nr:MAG: SAM-dependent methyltransferase [Cycloclasticus sp. symbiont of Poecilosclerida sp. M]
MPCDEIKVLIDQGVFQVKNSELTTSCYLSYVKDALTLHLEKEGESLSVCVDFVTGRAKHRRQYGGGKKQPLAKACGLDKHSEWTILDATAGLGKDAFVLASLGAEITLCEQHPALYGMLADALHRASIDAETALIANKMTCVCSDSIDYIDGEKGALRVMPDVIYLDPMYPERKRSAKIKKEMQVLQHLVSHSGSESKLLERALETANFRVVVKRPKSALPLNDLKSRYSISSVNTRYDIYVV